VLRRKRESVLLPTPDTIDGFTLTASRFSSSFSGSDSLRRLGRDTGAARKFRHTSRVLITPRLFVGDLTVTFRAVRVTVRGFLYIVKQGLRNNESIAKRRVTREVGE